jgi:hypothetical protein
MVESPPGGCAGLPVVGGELGLPDFWWLTVPAAALFVLVVPALRRRPIAATGVVTIALVVGMAGRPLGHVSVAFFWARSPGDALADRHVCNRDREGRSSDLRGFGKATVDEDPDGTRLSRSTSASRGYYDSGEAIQPTEPTIPRPEIPRRIPSADGWGEFTRTLTTVNGVDLPPRNAPPPITVPLPPATKAMVDCVEKCLGMPLVITGAAEKKGHLRDSKHPSGEAADFSFAKNPGLQNKAEKFFCCAAKCGFKYGETDPTPPHFHIQVPPGKKGGPGLIPTLPNATCTALGCE